MAGAVDAILAVGAICLRGARRQALEFDGEALIGGAALHATRGVLSADRALCSAVVGRAGDQLAVFTVAEVAAKGLRNVDRPTWMDLTIDHA